MIPDRSAARFLAVLAVLTVMVTGAATASGSTAQRVPARAGVAATRSGGPLRWGGCRGDGLPSGYQCATLGVPLDAEVPGARGPTIELALDRHRATGTKIGSLVVNPGGPGVSGFDDLPALVAQLTPALRSAFDIVGFDPPGVGRSDPVTCLSPGAFQDYLHLDPAPTTAAALRRLLSGDRTFAAGCEQRSRAILPHVSTVAAARDLDRIRQAIGDPTLTYLGYSYGTFLGATYAELYPHRVRALVLDGALDPALGVVAAIDAQSAAIDGDLRNLETSCARSSDCPWKALGEGGTLAAAFQELLAKVRARPLPTESAGRTVGPAELLYGTAAGIYSTTTWSDVESALAEATAGQGDELLALFDAYTQRRSNGSYSNTIEAETAVNCLDDPVPPLSELVADDRAVAQVAPVFGVLDLDSEASCEQWPIPPTGSPHAITAHASPPIVVVGSTGDPVTPYSWAEHLAAELSRGVLLTRVGDGHTGYGASSCVRRAVDRYLIHLVTPPLGQRCPSD